MRPPEIGGYGLAAHWSAEVHQALHSVLPGARAGDYGDFGTLTDLAQALRHAFVYDGRSSRFPLPPAPARPAGRRPRGPSLLGLYAQPLSDRQPSARRAQPSAHERREAQNRGRSRAHLAARALAVKARSGAPPPRSSTSRITGSRSGVGPSAQGAGPSSPPSAGSLQSYQIRKTRPHTCARGSSGVNWAGEPHARILAWDRRLIHLRRQLPALADGRRAPGRVCVDEEARWFVLERGPVTVVGNLAAHAPTVPLTNDRSRPILLASEAEIVVNAAGVAMPAEALVILGLAAR